MEYIDSINGSVTLEEGGANLPRVLPFFELNQAGDPDLLGCLAYDTVPNLKLLPGLYPIVGPAGSGKTSYLFGPGGRGISLRSVDCVYNRIRNAFHEFQPRNNRPLTLDIWQISEPEYPPYGTPASLFNGFINSLVSHSHKVMFVDSLRDLTLCQTENWQVAEAYTDIDQPVITHADVAGRIVESIGSAKARVEVRPSNAYARGGLPASYVAALANINSLAIERDVLVIAVLNPLFITEESYVSVVDSVTMGCLRVGGGQSLLRVYDVDRDHPVRISVSIGASGNPEWEALAQRFYETEHVDDGSTNGSFGFINPANPYLNFGPQGESEQSAAGESTEAGGETSTPQQEGNNNE